MRPTGNSSGPQENSPQQDVPAHTSASDAAPFVEPSAVELSAVELSAVEQGAAETRARELGILKAIAEALNSATDVQQALEHTLALVADLLGLRTGWVWLLDPETTQFYLAAAQDLPPYLQEPVRMTGDWCLCTDRFRRGKLAPTNIDVLKCSRLGEAFEAHVSEATLGLRYHASIPLAFRGRKLGIINIAGPSWRRLTPEELQLLETIAYQVGIAVERARLAAESARLARAEERARLAREIHDTLAQGLTAIALDVEGALRHLESNPERARERLRASARDGTRKPGGGASLGARPARGAAGGSPPARCARSPGSGLHLGDRRASAGALAR